MLSKRSECILIRGLWAHLCVQLVNNCNYDYLSFIQSKLHRSKSRTRALFGCSFEGFFRENARCFWYTHYRHFCWRRCVLINKYRKRTNHRLFLPTHNWNGVCGRYFTFGRCFVISLFFHLFCIDFVCKRCSCCILITYCHQLWSKGAHVYKDLSGLLML